MTRLVLRIGIVILLTGIVGFSLIDFIFRMRFEHDFSDNPPTPLVVMAELVTEQFRDLPPEQIPQKTKELADRIGARIDLVHIDAPTFPREVRNQIGSKPGEFRFHPPDHALYLRIKGDTFLVFRDEDRRPFISNSTIILAISTALLLTFISALVLALPITRRLEKLRHAALRIARGERDARADETGPLDSFGILARSFNRMASTTEQLIDNQRQLLEAVSHELRTPTARMRFALEMMLTATNDTEKDKLLHSIDDDLTELDDLIKELLLYHRFEKNANPLDIQPVKVSKLLSKLAERLSHLNQDISVEIQASEPLPALSVDKRSFMRVMQNLLTNAMKYAENRVSVTITALPAWMQIDISDDGPGIAEDLREAAFRPFTRLDPSRSKSTGGAGLGLAIARRIVDAHDAKIEIRETPGGGATIRTSWPVSCR